MGFVGTRLLFPLNGAGRLGSKIVKYAVDTFNFVNDSVCDLVENSVRNFFDGSGHSVLGIDCADDRGPAFIAAFFFNADALDIGNRDEVLPYGLCEAAVIEFFAEDRVCFTECVESVAGDCAEATNTETGTGEGLTVNHRGGETESSADYADFILKEELQGFNEFKSFSKVSRKSAYVVVGLTAFLPSPCLTLSRMSG